MCVDQPCYTKLCILQEQEVLDYGQEEEPATAMPEPVSEPAQEEQQQEQSAATPGKRGGDMSAADTEQQAKQQLGVTATDAGPSSRKRRAPIPLYQPRQDKQSPKEAANGTQKQKQKQQGAEEAPPSSSKQQQQQQQGSNKGSATPGKQANAPASAVKARISKAALQVGRGLQTLIRRRRPLVHTFLPHLTGFRCFADLP